MFTFYDEPKVIKKLLTHEECDFLINHNNESLKKTSFSRSESDICDVKSLFKRISKHEDRIKSLTDRCVNLGNFTHGNLEDLVVMNYKQGGFILEHLDPTPDLPNIRTHTIIMYLNDNYTGGETHFKNINKTFKLEKGDALFFSSVNSDNKITNLSMHEGKPVKSGEKWICNLWIRGYPLSN